MLVFYICLEQVKITGREVFIFIRVTKSFTRSMGKDVWSLIRLWAFPYNESHFCGGGGREKPGAGSVFGTIEASEAQARINVMTTKEESDFLHGLVEQYGEALEKYCLRCLCTVPDRYELVKDILQDTYTEAVKNADSLMTHENVLGWLKKVCYYTIADELRARKQHPVALMDNEQLELAARKRSTIDALNRWEHTALPEVLEAVAAILTEEEKAVFNAVFLDGYTMKECAEMNQMRFDLVRSKVNTIRRKLRKYFAVLCILGAMIGYR